MTVAKVENIPPIAIILPKNSMKKFIFIAKCELFDIITVKFVKVRV